MNSEIMARLSLNEERFEQGLVRANSQWKRFASSLRSQKIDVPMNWEGAQPTGANHPGAIGRTLERKFGLGDAFKGLLGGLGFASIDKIVEKITSGFQEEAEAAKAVADESERAVRAQRALQDFKRSDKDNLTALKADEKRMREEMETANREKRFGIEPEKNGTKAAKLDADIKENALEQAKLEKKIAEDRKRDQDDYAKAHKAVADARRERTFESLSLEDRLAASLKRQNQLEREYSAMKKGTVASEEKLLEIEKERKEEAETRRQIEERDAAALERQKRFAEEVRDAQRAHDERVADLKERRTDAAAAVADAKQNIRDARHDVVAFTLGDAASGKRGTPTDRARARAIQRDEDTARRLFDSGNTVDQFENGKHVQRDFQFFQNRAEQARGAFSKLTTADQKPFAAMEKAVVDSEKHLAKIVDELATTDVED